MSARIRAAGGLVAAAYGRFVRHGGDGLAAGVAFGTLLSIAPLLVVAIAVAGAFLGDGSARDEVIGLVRDSLGRRGAELVGGWVDQANAWSGTATALGLGGFLFGAARLVAIVDAAFDVIFEAPPRSASFLGSLRAYLADQALGVVVTILAGVVIVVSIALRAVSGSALGVVDGTPIAYVVGALRVAASFLLLALALGIVYRTLPPHRLAKRDVVEGALVTAALLDVTTWVLSFVLDRIDVAAPYGAAGAVIAALVWLLVASSLFLLGAEITAERAARRRARAQAVEAGLEPSAPPLAAGTAVGAQRT